MIETKLLPITQESIDLAAEYLRKGTIFALPTETVYGIAASAYNGEAVKDIFRAKGRPQDNPLIVHIAKMDMLYDLAREVSEDALKLAKAFWPGPLTMIFEKSDIVPYGTTGGLDTVAVRMPSDPVAAELIRAAGGFVSAPSANTSGRPSPTTAEHVLEDLGGKIDMVIDGGSVEIGLESTILDMTVEPPMILRPGAITADMFEEVIGPVSVDETILGSESKKPPKAPGMKYRHYAPKARLAIVEGDLREEILAIRQLAYAASREGKKVGIIATDETLPFYKYGLVKDIGTRENEKTIARNLYRILREFDEEDVDTIYSESFAMQGIGKAIMNRLEKAAGHLRISAAAVVKEQRYRRIIFVSSADSARGPMAAELLRQEDLEQEYVIDSMGIVVLFPEPANQKAEAIMKSAGMTLAQHTSRQFNDENLQDDVLILAINEAAKSKLLAEYQNAVNVYTINEFAEDETEIPDPYGKPLTAYGECYEVLKVLVGKVAEKLNAFAKGEK